MKWQKQWTNCGTMSRPKPSGPVAKLPASVHQPSPPPHLASLPFFYFADCGCHPFLFIFVNEQMFLRK